MPPAVSVVVPCFNQARFLADALRSVLAQSRADWEAIVVDDGSTDDTRAAASSFPDARIRYRYQDNRGLSGARNTGIGAARAPLIALLDSDDIWEPDYLEKMCACLAAHSGAAAAYCGFKYIDTEGRLIGRESLRVVPPDCFRRVLTSEGDWLVPSAVIVRREAVLEAGLFDESLRALEDTDLWLRLSARHQFVGWPEALVRYRRHPGSMSANPGLMVGAFQQLIEKHLRSGDSVEADPREHARVSHAMLHRYGALTYLGSRDVQTAAEHVRQLFALAPEKRDDMGFWRSALRAHLPQEVRGDPLTRSALPVSVQSVQALLGALAVGSGAGETVRSLPGIKSRAFLAVAEEAVRSRLWQHAATWLCRSALASPAVMLARPFWGTIARGIGRAVGIRDDGGISSSDQLGDDRR